MFELKSNPVLPIIQVHAVMNFWFAVHNIDKNTLIQKAFGHLGEHEVRHLFIKFVGEYRCDVMRFLGEIDVVKRKDLIVYIMNNYKGVEVKEVEEEYFIA